MSVRPHLHEFQVSTWCPRQRVSALEGNCFRGNHLQRGPDSTILEYHLLSSIRSNLICDQYITTFGSNKTCTTIVVLFRYISRFSSLVPLLKSATAKNHISMAQTSSRQPLFQLVQR